VREIRYREISTAGADLDDLSLDEVAYKTPVTRERFLQWVTPEGKIAGFLRLSLPDRAFVAAHTDELPTTPDEAMIREVHVYGMAARVGDQGQAAQHHGLGRSLVERACEIARDAGYARINVISAIGTREYYRHLGFCDHDLYLQKEL
jgi:elongator complex protein 3